MTIVSRFHVRKCHSMRRVLILIALLAAFIIGGLVYLGNYAKTHPAPGADKDIPVNDILSR